MKTSYLRLVSALIVMAVLGLSALGAAQTQTITLYSIWPESFCTPMFAEFTAQTGIRINFVRHSSGEVLARLIAEKQNPRVDMVFGGLLTRLRQP